MSYYCIKSGIGRRRHCTRIKDYKFELPSEGKPVSELGLRGW